MIRFPFEFEAKNIGFVFFNQGKFKIPSINMKWSVDSESNI